MKIIDNFLPQEYQDVLERTFLGPEFPWFFHPATSGKDHKYPDLPGICDTYQFVHNIFFNGSVNSNCFDLVQNVMYKLMLAENIDTSRLLKIKANLTLQSVHLKDTFAPPHIDFPDFRDEFITCLYYVNDSDGDTLFFDSNNNIVNRVTPKKGRLAYFKGDYTHSKEAPQHHATRCVINFNFALRG
jgi:hypothetical protein